MKGKYEGNIQLFSSERETNSVRANWIATAQTWELSQKDCTRVRGKIVEQQESGFKLFLLAFASNKTLSKQLIPLYIKENLLPFKYPQWLSLTSTFEFRKESSFQFTISTKTIYKSFGTWKKSYGPRKKPLLDQWNQYRSCHQFFWNDWNKPKKTLKYYIHSIPKTRRNGISKNFREDIQCI